MKKGITLGLVLCLCMVMLAGCGKQEQEDKNPLAVYKNGKEVVFVGMTLEEAEKILGEGKKIEYNDNSYRTFDSYEYESLNLNVKKDKADSKLKVSSLEITGNKYTDFRGATVGMPVNNLNNYYSDKEIKMSLQFARLNTKEPSPCRIFLSEDKKIIDPQEKEIGPHLIQFEPSGTEEDIINRIRIG